MTQIGYQFYLNSREAWDGMLLAIKSARVSIELEQYIIANDKISWEFFKALREKQKAGVKVRILADTVGSWSLYNSPVPRIMRNEGIEVRFYNIVSPWRIGSIFSWFFRDHRKILVVDDLIGFTGGVGIRDDMTNWRDTHVRVTGPIVAEMKHAFEEMWAQSVDRRLISRIKKARAYMRGFHFLTNAPYFKKRFLYQSLIDAVRGARSNIYLTTPYFVPDGRLRRVLRLARKRGVDVRLLVPKEADEILVGHAGCSYYEEMLEAGVRIYEYDRTFMHAKTVAIDDEWATVGSLNLDNMSFFLNYEANIVSTDSNFIKSVSEHFVADMKISKEIDAEEWAYRPFINKLKEMITIPFRKFL